MAALGNMCARYTLFSLKQLPRRFDFAQRHFPVSPTGKEYHSRVPAVHLSSTTGNVLSVSGCRTWKAHLYWLNCQSRNIAPLLSLSHCRLYSNRRGSLTDDLLKAKIAADKAATDESNNSGDNKDEQDQKKEEKKSRFAGFTGKNAWKLGIIFLGGMSVFASGSLLILWGAPALDDNGQEITDEYTPLPKWQAYPRRAFREFRFFKKMIEEPSSDKLLPDPLKEPYYQPPYTLVLEMTGVLVHPDWTLNTGWRFKKRPAVTYFLQQVGPPLFEIVIYTHEQGFTAFPIIDGLDPQGMVSFRLFRDATRYIDGTHVKDLDCLNRDLKKVIVVDCDGSAVKLHPDNALCLAKWTGNDDDRLLIDLATFLRTLAMSGVDDVRPILDYYSQFDEPLEAFKENQRKLQEEQAKSMQHLKEQDDAKKPLKNWGFSLSGRRR